ncbi:hypothetical protein ACHAXH_001630 [Discostella pseudostelligera]
MMIQLLLILLTFVNTAALAAAAETTSIFANTDYISPSSTLMSNARSSTPKNNFSSFNQIFSEVIIIIPNDIEVSQSGLNLTISELTCTNLQVHDIQLATFSKNNTIEKGVSIDIYGVSFTCAFIYSYAWSMLSGAGKGTAIIDDNDQGNNIHVPSLSMDISFYSTNYTEHPPQNVTVSSCNAANMNIADITIDGDGLGLLGTVVNLVEPMLRDTVEEQLRKTACEELEKLADGDGATAAPMDKMVLLLYDKIESYLIPLDDRVTDPLSEERNSTAHPKNELASYVNFQSMGGIMNWTIAQVQSFLGTKSSSNGELGINTYIRENFLNETTGRIAVDPSYFPSLGSDEGVLFEGEDMFTDTSMTITSLEIGGLDSINGIDVLNTIGNYTLQNTMKMDYLSIVMELEVVMKASSQSNAIVVAPTNATSITENFTVEFNATNVEMDLSTFLGIQKASLGNIELGSVLHTKNILPCLLSAVEVAKITGLSLTVQDMSDPILSGFSDDGMDHLFSTAAASFFDMYERVLIKAMPNFFQTYVRRVANDFIDKTLPKYECAEFNVTKNNNEVVDFRDLLLSEERAVALLGQGDSPYGDLFRMIYSFLERKMSETDENGLSQMNDLVGSFTKRQSNVSGDLYYPGYIFQQDFNLDLNGLNADIEIGISDLRISNLDSLGSPITMLQPVSGESSVLNNSAMIAAGSEPLRAELRLFIKANGSGLDVLDDFVLGLNLRSVEAMLAMLMQMSEKLFVNFPLKDVMNLNCWMSTIITPVLDKYGNRVEGPDSGMVVKRLSMAVAEASLDIDCTECSSPLVVEMASIVGSDEAIKDTTEAANMIFNFMSNLLGGDLFQSKLDRMLADADRKCPHSPLYESNYSGVSYAEMEAPTEEESAYGFLLAIVLVIAISALVVSLFCFLARFIIRRRHHQWMATLNLSQKLELAKMQRQEKEREKDLNSRMSSLVRSEEVPVFLRVFVPVVIFGNVALFVFAGEPFNVDGFYEFSLVKSLIEMWIAGARSLAVIIAIFSGVWPYTKQLMVLFIWFVPTKWVSSKRRSSMLFWLDVLGKWSMVDVFVFIMTLASFGISIQSPDNLSFLPSSLYSINLLVVPLWGIYAYVLAILISQLLSHVIIHYHNKSVSAAVAAQEAELNLSPSNTSETKEVLRSHQYTLDYEASNKRVVVERRIDWVLSGIVLALTILVICGCAFSSFSIEVFGLVGLAVESGNQFKEAKVSYSIFSLANMIMDQARYLNTASDLAGLGTLAAVVVITVFLVPLAQAASLMAHWFVPMTKKQRSWNIGLNEVLYTWQYMEVYVISIIITAWQLGGVSEHMINVYCGALKDTLSSLAYYGILNAEDAQCFKVNASVEPGSWVLVAASILLFMLNHFVVRASMQKTLDDNVPPEQRLHTDRWMKRKESMVETQGSSGGAEEEEEEEEDAAVEDEKVRGNREPSVSPVAPRFTDYYFFVTNRIDEEYHNVNEAEMVTTDGNV